MALIDTDAVVVESMLQTYTKKYVVNGVSFKLTRAINSRLICPL